MKALDYLLFTIGLLPSNDKYLKIKKKLNHVSLSKIFSLLYYFRFRAISKPINPINLIEKLKLSENTKKYINNISYDENNIWQRLKCCGSGITKDHFIETKIYTVKNHKYNNTILFDNNNYSKSFINLFEFLWERDIALRRLEWKLLRVVHIYHRNDIIIGMDSNIIYTMLHKDLIDIIIIGSDKLIYSIGRSLIFKLKDHNIYKMCRKMLELDTAYFTIILAHSLNHDGYYDIDKLTDLLETRIKSDKILTKEFYNIM